MKHKHRFWPWIAVGVFLATAALAPLMVEKIAFAAQKGAQAAAREQLAELSRRDQLSGLFRAVAKTVKPAVVEVRVEKRVRVPQMLGNDLEDFLRRFWGDDFPFPRRRPGPQDQQPRQPRERYYMHRGLGSGVIVDAKNGYILTNHHVVGGADEVEIILSNGRKYEAEWVRSDWKTDLAVVKVKAKDLIDAPLGDSDKMAVGDWVLAIGAPERLPQTVTAGIISAKGRTRGHRPYEDYLQTDAAINHGNSGGPLVNMKGEVIGINTAIVSRTGVNEGIGLAIPSNMAKSVMAQLVDKGKVVRGYLGVRIQDVDEALAESFGLPDANGALVTKVDKDTPAAKAEIKEEDFIVAVAGEPVADADELRHRVAGLAPGKKVKLTLYREGKQKKVTVTVGTQPEQIRARRDEPADEDRPRQLGLQVRTLTPELARRLRFREPVRGVLITGVDPGSDAYEQGVRPGMVIERVNGKPVKSADEFAASLAEAEKAGRLRLRIVTPDGGARYVLIHKKK